MRTIQQIQDELNRREVCWQEKVESLQRNVGHLLACNDRLSVKYRRRGNIIMVLFLLILFLLGVLSCVN